MRWTRTIAAIAAMVTISAVAAAQPPPPPLTPLPPPPQPPGNLVTTAKANLGKALFWDEQLSSTRTMACGSCHRPETGGSDPRSVLGSAHATHPGLDGQSGTADDITGSPGVVLNAESGALQWSPAFGMSEQVTGRMAPSHVNSAYAPQLFWDGRAAQAFRDPETGAVILPNGGALENQVLEPPVSSSEMAHIGRAWVDVAARVAAAIPLVLSPSLPADLAAWIAGRGYADLFTEAFGSPGVTGARIAMAIASYERTQFSTQTPFDAVIAGTATLTPQAAAGMQLFGQLACARCHSGSLMSDNQFHYIGVRPAAEDAGRSAVTGLPQNLGQFRTPSLRNVSLRPAFFHNGRFSRLEDVIDFYDRGGDFNAPNKNPLIVPLNLSPPQKAQLLAFLRRPLTDTRVASASAPFDHPRLYTEGGLVPVVLAGGVAARAGVPQPVALEPPFAGNPAFTVGVFNALGGAEAVLIIDDAEPPASGGIPAAGSFARLSTTLSGAGIDAGFGSVTLAIPDDEASYGRVLYGRWYVADASAPSGVASSPAFRMQIFGPNGAGTPLVVSPGPVAASLRLYPSQPNPFPRSTLVRFDLYTASRVTLAVFDVGGRRVRSLIDRAAIMPGAHAVTWDGKDDRGLPVPGGIYFYRLDTGRDLQVSRVVRLQ